MTARRAKAGEKVDFERLAQDLMFGTSFNIREAGLDYRKGKTVEDVHKARRKAIANGHAKTEFELSMLELYLKEVFKAKHIEPVSAATLAPSESSQASA